MKNVFKYYLTLAALGGSLAAGAQITIDHKGKDGNDIRVTAITPYILRIDNSLGAPAGVQSVLDLKPQADAAVINSNGTTLTTTAGITATFTPDGALSISSTQPGSTIYDNGIRSSADGKNTLSLATSGKGSFYGAGERGHSLKLNGDTLVMYNRQNYGYTGNDPRISQMNITMPLVLNSAGYALVFDDFAAAELTLSNPIKYVTESHLPVSYYYIAGDNMADLTESLTELTGRQPLPPLWALGYIVSKYGYRTQAETEGIVDTLKMQGYPLDGIVLDLYWYGKEQDMGRLDWDPVQWPEPEKMLQGLNSRGVKLIPISQPYVLRNGHGVDNYNDLAPKGIFVSDSIGGPQEVKIWVGEGAMFDVSNPDTRLWLKDRYASLTDMGIGGWWGDLGEPEVHPESGRHANGLNARLYHNKYGNDWSSIISELYAERYPDRRLMTLMRGGTTGLQRHSVFPWSTDVSRSWGGLEPQIRIMLNSGLSGLGYMSSDLGGFAVDPENPYLPELYLRWLQAGLFTPVFRTHAQQYAEPIRYPMYADLLKGIVRERYRWLPYNYTLAYENAAEGLPLARPLDFRDENASGKYDHITDQYLWGDNLLVAPVLSPGARSRSITLPEGSDWYVYAMPTKLYKGGCVIDSFPAPLESLPLFVRAGAFIPTADYAMENTGDYRSDHYSIAWYSAPDTESCYTLYDDNHISPKALTDNQYRLITFCGRRSGAQLVAEITSSGSYKDAPATVSLDFTVYGLNKEPKALKINGKKQAFSYSADNKSISFTLTFTPGRKSVINIS